MLPRQFYFPFDIAVDRIARASCASPQHNPSRAERERAVDSVHTVFEQLAEPDEEMVRVGMRELGDVIPHFKNMPLDFQRRTVACVWRNMLEKARS